MIARFIIGIPLAVLVTLSLFMLMRILVQPERSLIEEVQETVAIDITRAQRNEESEADRRTERPDVEDQPPPPPPMDTRTERPDLGGLQVGIPDIDLNLNSGAVGPIDGEIQPLVRVPPEYPIRAAERGIEGQVCVRFTVTPEGTVTNPEVYYSDSSLLNSASVRAISRFRYQPKIEDGQPVARPNVRFCFDYNLEEASRR
jgi:protein TonB